MQSDRFEHFLEDISRCFLERDLSLCLSRVKLPFSVIAQTENVAMHTDSEVAQHFQIYLKACDALKLEIIDRNVVSFEACGDGSWLGTFRTRLVASGRLVAEPYISTALMWSEQDRWKMSSMMTERVYFGWMECSALQT